MFRRAFITLSREIYTEKEVEKQMETIVPDYQRRDPEATRDDAVDAFFRHAILSSNVRTVAQADASKLRARG